MWLSYIESRLCQPAMSAHTQNSAAQYTHYSLPLATLLSDHTNAVLLFSFYHPTARNTEAGHYLSLNLPFVWWRCDPRACDHSTLPPIVFFSSCFEWRKIHFPSDTMCCWWVTGDCETAGTQQMKLNEWNRDMNKTSFLGCFQSNRTDSTCKLSQSDLSQCDLIL